MSDTTTTPQNSPGASTPPPPPAPPAAGGGPPVQVQASGGSGFTADFDIEITYGSNVYSLKVIPKTPGGVYGVEVTEAPVATPTQTTDLLKFAIKDKSNWGVGLDAPSELISHQFGKFKINKLQFDFGEGTADFPT
jgi:hypothetical protein